MDGKIALEEHWAVDETLRITGQPVGAGAFWDETRRLLVDFRDRRLAGMDAHGIEFAILGLNSPALQAVLDPAAAAALAHRTNDMLAEEIAHNPRRFAGFAGLPMQNPEAAAKELTRCVKELGFKGAMVNCFTQRHVRRSLMICRNSGHSGRRWPRSTCRSISTRDLLSRRGRFPMKGIAGSTARFGISAARPRPKRCG